MGKLHSEERDNAGVPQWSLWAWGSWRWLSEAHMVWALSFSGWVLNWEQSQNLGKLAVTHQVLAILSQLVQKLLSGFPIVIRDSSLTSYKSNT